MQIKDYKTIKQLYIIIALIIVLIFVLIYFFFIKNNSYATGANSVEGIDKTIETNSKNYETKKDDNGIFKISKAKEIDINKIIANNTKQVQKEVIETREEVLEYLTKYKTNPELPKGTMQVIQEGREGLQQISVKKVFQDGQVISEEQIGAKVTKASVDKIIEIGGASYSSNYKVKEGEMVYVTADRTPVMSEPNLSSTKVATISKNEQLKVTEIDEEWYKIISSIATGWVKKESTTYKNPNATNDNSGQKSKAELLQSLDFNMALNKPSGLSLEQFKQVLTDDRDVYGVFEANAEYFYYVEKQYNINGIFIAAIGIHESAWGTSAIARNKLNLFGYGAYDSNPYNGAYSFDNISESVDLMARVLTKYYLNPAGTAIYNDEKAVASHYHGPTVTGVNTEYATDKNWANCVYRYMKYLYEKL